MPSRAKSEAFEAIHSAATGLYKAGSIDKQTMHEFDETCLRPVPKYKAADIARIRHAARVSQAVLAMHLNVSVSAVQKWESGAKSVSGAAAKLLYLVERAGSVDAIK